MIDSTDITGSLKAPPSEGFREAYVLHLADNSLIMGHRLSEWTGHGPMLEQDIALSNIALDLIGQSRNLYQYAAELINQNNPFQGGEVTEDSIAYFREAKKFKNILLVELPNGDWGKTILKLFLFSSYQYYLYQKLIDSFDKQLSAIAEKSLKEVTYHVRWSSEWVIRLGDGTAESHARIKKSLDELWSYTEEMFIPSDYEIESAENNIGVKLNFIKPEWDKKITETFSEATLASPLKESLSTAQVHSPGKSGIHTEYLEILLSEMQYLQRTYPGCQW